MVVLRIALLIGLAWLLGRTVIRYRTRNPKPLASDVVTVQCHQCGLVIPEQDAVRVNGHSYCREHAPGD